MILNRTTTAPFRVNELVTFYELNSPLLAYMLILPHLAPSFPLNKTIKYSMSNKINTRFSEYTNGYKWIFFLFLLLSLNYFFFLLFVTLV